MSTCARLLFAATFVLSGNSLAATPLSEPQLSAACRAAANQATADSAEWLRLDCKSRLGMDPFTIFRSDYDHHFRRCRETLGTVIADDQAKRRALLDQCRAASPAGSTTTAPGWQGGTSSTPAGDAGAWGKSGSGAGQGYGSGTAADGAGQTWEIVSLDLGTLREYRYRYRWVFQGNRFEGRYLDPASNPSTFSGELFPDGRIRYSQTHGQYKAHYAARMVAENRYEGAAFDSRNNIFLITLIRR